MPDIILQQAADVAFALLDGRPVLFSEAKQQIYELDQVGAYIWCRIAQHAPVAVICEELGQFGIDASRADRFVRLALNDWFGLALLDIHWHASTDFTLRANLGRCTVQIRALNEELLERVAPLFCSSIYETGDDDDITIEIVEFDGLIFFKGDCGRVDRCEAEGLAPAIKAYLTERIVRSGRSIFAMHAASLTKDDKGLILCGEPGAGKSTLTLQLIEAGFQYAGDDVVLVGADGKVSGVPFAPGIKPGSWELLSGLRSDVNDLVTYRRPDGVLVRYVPVRNIHRGSFSPEWIVFLNRVADASPGLTPIAQIDSVRRIVEGAFAADGKLSQGGFLALKRITGGARSFELTYSDSAEARRMLVDVCQSQSWSRLD
jgi:hypothetical protein